MTLPNYSNRELIKKILMGINKLVPSGSKVKIMHVCGSHEHAVQKFGIRSLLPENLEIFAGPGCPVCVCPAFEITEAINLAKKGKVIATYGDMLRVPTSKGSLMDLKADGADVRLIYGPDDALHLARKSPGKEFVFFSVGFETTTAPIAAMLNNEVIPENLSVLTSHRLTVPAMELLLGIGDLHIDGFIAPGNVSIIMGSEHWKRFTEAYNMPVAISGFEPADILLGIFSILKQKKQKAELINTYGRVVSSNGNVIAKKCIEAVFTSAPSWWRGIGKIPDSGLVLKEDMSKYDARKRFSLLSEPGDDELPPGCSCHLVMLGKIYPPSCPMFGKNCTPATPYGPCMVSHEGTCLIWSRFRGMHKF